MKINYSKKIIDGSRYSKVEITPLTDEEITEKEGQGYVFAPYVCQEHTEESLAEYETEMDKYKKRHKCCPKCGIDGKYSTTLMGYIFTDLETYQDKNRCECMECGFVHIAHDRVPDPKDFREDKLNRISDDIT